jgi:hypothetical protein
MESRADFQQRQGQKVVTSPILMAEVVADMPKGTSDGSAKVQYIFWFL